MSNVLATTSVVAKEAVAILENMLSFSGMVNRDWEDEFTSNMDLDGAAQQAYDAKIIDDQLDGGSLIVGELDECESLGSVGVVVDDGRAGRDFTESREYLAKGVVAGLVAEVTDIDFFGHLRLLDPGSFPPGCYWSA